MPATQGQTFHVLGTRKAWRPARDWHLRYSMAKQRKAAQWEYKLVSMGNPLEPDVELRANTIGKQGWELVTIDAGVWIFKRPGPKEATAVGELEAIVEETVPVVATANQEPSVPILPTSPDVSPT